MLRWACLIRRTRLRTSRLRRGFDDTEMERGGGFGVKVMGGVRSEGVYWSSD